MTLKACMSTERHYLVKVNKEPDKLYFSFLGAVCILVVSVLMQ